MKKARHTDQDKSLDYRSLILLELSSGLLLQVEHLRLFLLLACQLLSMIDKGHTRSPSVY